MTGKTLLAMALLGTLSSLWGGGVMGLGLWLGEIDPKILGKVETVPCASTDSDGGASACKAKCKEDVNYNGGCCFKEKGKNCPGPKDASKPLNEVLASLYSPTCANDATNLACQPTTCICCMKGFPKCGATNCCENVCTASEECGSGNKCESGKCVCDEPACGPDKDKCFKCDKGGSELCVHTDENCEGQRCYQNTCTASRSGMWM